MQYADRIIACEVERTYRRMIANGRASKRPGSQLYNLWIPWKRLEYDSVVARRPSPERQAEIDAEFDRRFGTAKG